MTDVPFPILTAPGRLPQASSGRLINTYPEKLPDGAGKANAYWRTPGLAPWGLSPDVNFRGALAVGGTAYAAIGSKVYSFPAGGGVGAVLPGTLPGSTPVFMARNNATTPDIVIVSPGDGAFVVTGSGVANYPSSIPNIPNAVVYHRGFFIFTSGNGKCYASGVDVTTVATTDFATAASKPDALLCPVPLGNGQLLLCGDASIEVWGGDPNVGVAGFPFVYVSTIARGIIGPYAMAGDEDGWGYGIFFVGDDFKVSSLDTSSYTPTPISPPDLNLLIENDPNKTSIQVSVYVSLGHGFVVVKGTGWCWEYDTTGTSWHERKSHLRDDWRGALPFKFSNQWICGDTLSGNLFRVDGNTMTEFGVNAVHTISSSGAPTGGSFTLNYQGQITTALPYNATASAVQLALTGLIVFDTGDISCSGGPLPTPVSITFSGKFGSTPIALPTVANSLTGGSNPFVSATSATTGYVGDPLRMRIETGPLGAFPKMIRVNGIELYLAKGVGIATGLDPLQTDPGVEISISRDGGMTWTSPRVVKLGQQSITNRRVRAAIWGQADVQGVRWRFDMSSPVQFGFMGADMQADPLS